MNEKERRVTILNVRMAEGQKVYLAEIVKK